MRLSELEKWGIPSRVIQLWRERQGETLLPIQDRAVRRNLLGKPMQGQEHTSVRMVISAPTSSGKSFCAEMAAVRALTSREKTVMLFPLKSLAEQNYSLFNQTYGHLGVRCLIVTGDHPENDDAFARGHFQIAVAIYEKFDSLLTTSLDALKNIGLIVVDEIQTIGEPRRGAVLERLLTKVRASEYQPGIIGLSAVIGDEAGSAGKLAQWLGATLVEECSRPVELMRGVATEGTYYYRTFNNGFDGNEPFADSDHTETSFDKFIKQIKDTENSTLIFLKSRMDTVDAAFKLAASVKWPEAKKALSELEGEEPSFLIRSLRQALSRGVAFHNSDLSPEQRLIVEQAFLEKEIKALFSTTTLAMGVNLSADTVYLETVKYTSGKYDRRPSLEPVSRSEFENMSGRAGRLTGDRETCPAGRAIILAENKFDRDILWDTYIAGINTKPLKSAFKSMPLEDWLLDIIVSGLASNSDSIESVYAHSFRYHLNQDGLSDDVTAALQRLTADGFIENSPEVKPTVFGLATTRTGLSVKQATHYRNQLRQGYPNNSVAWVALALSGPDWDTPPAMLSRLEQTRNTPLRMLYQCYHHLLDEAALLIGRGGDRKPLAYRQTASLKALFLLERWRNLVPVQQLEETFQMHLGQIMHLGETVGHLVAAIAELIQSSEASSSLPSELRQLAFSLRHGIPADLKPIHDYLGELLSRHDFAALHRAGICSLRQFCELDSDGLLAVFRDTTKLKKINEKQEQLKEELDMQTRWTVAENHHEAIRTSTLGSLESIEVDGSYEKERYLVRINGFPVRLTGKSFKYFTKLAWSRLNRDSGWIYKEDIEIGFNQARYLYRMKGEINASLNMSWPVVENNRLGYYRLDVDPSKIRLNESNLRNHPDYEVRSMFLNKTAEPVN
ncbi:MAG: DEAD/DEAH box helicase [Candidatus Zixiibacteriota bacterium]|nr:MAG: DEAD/DEAH box helicase [candidate division Zixibacteria bacterium]